jgi:hypothetical protein
MTDEEIRVERDGRPESLPSISRYSRRVFSMLKPFTLSLSLAVALGLCSVSMAGLHDNNCTTCGLASPQGVVASPQGTSAGCGAPACGKKHNFGAGLAGLKNLFHHQVTYEWVLKKKHNFSFGGGGCTTCGGSAVYPSGQGAAPSGQYAAPSGQYHAASGQYTAPAVYGAGQRAFIPARSTTSIASAPAEMTPAGNGGEEVPPAPEVKAPSSPGGLLLPTPSPSGN